MGQLLEVTAKPFKAIHFRLNGRLVPDDRLVLEKHIALARKAAFMQANNELAQPDMNYILKVNRAFSAGGGISGSPISLPGEAAAGSQTGHPVLPAPALHPILFPAGIHHLKRPPHTPSKEAALKHGWPPGM